MWILESLKRGVKTRSPPDKSLPSLRRRETPRLGSKVRVDPRLPTPPLAATGLGPGEARPSDETSRLLETCSNSPIWVGNNF